MSILDTLEEIASDIGEEIENDASDVATFFEEAFEYARDNISGALVKAVADAVAAAESAFVKDGGVDRYAFAFSNAVAALAKDGAEFVEADINFAIEAVIQVRNKRKGTAEVKEPATSEPVPGETTEPDPQG